MRQPFTPEIRLIAVIFAIVAVFAPGPLRAQPGMLEPLELRPVFATTQPAALQPSKNGTPPPLAAGKPPPTSQPAVEPPRLASSPARATSAPAVEEPSSQPTSAPTDATTSTTVETKPVEPPPPPIVSEDVVLDHLQTRFERIAQVLTPATAALRVVRAPVARAIPTREAPGPAFGSAIVISADGLLLTCEHVVRGALTVEVTLSDGRQYRAVVLGADARSDVAILGIRAGHLEPLVLRSAVRLRRGHLCFAAGFPIELSGSAEPAMTQGVVCATGRPLPVSLGAEDDRDYGDMIQFTAPVSGGFSGGPLVNLNGELVGMVTVNEGASAGVFGYARPMGPRLMRLISRLSRGESIDYGYLGLTTGSLTAALAGQLGLTRLEGAAVHLVEPGGAADRAGLVEDDVIIALNGTDITTAESLVSRAGELPPGSTAEVAYVRDGRRATTRLLVGRRHAPAGASDDGGLVEFRGATLASADANLRQMANFPADAMVVTLVRDGSAAQRAGLSPGDVVVRFQGAPASGDRIISLAHTGGDVLLGMATGGSVLVGSD